MDHNRSEQTAVTTRKVRGREPCASVVIASSGTEPEKVLSTRYGIVRSRAAANLQYTTNDAERVFDLWSNEDDDLPMSLHRLLIEPSLQEVEGTIEEVSSLLLSDYENNVGLDIFFAGHGEKGTGNLMVKDGSLSPERFLSIQDGDVARSDKRVRTIGVWLDSCYSGAFLIRLALAALGSTRGFALDEGMASCLPDEQCYEMESLGHGVFTYSRLNRGNRNVDSNRFNHAILRNDDAAIAKALQGLVGMLSSPAAFLTHAEQFPVLLTKHVLDVEGGFSSVALDFGDEFADVARRLSSFRLP